MRFKGTLVLLLVFGILGGYVYFTEFRGKEDRQKQEETKKRLFGGEAKDITEITLEHEGRTFSAVRKGEKGWDMTSPVGVEADPDAWDQLAMNFVQIDKDSTVSSEKADLAPYGLDKPAVAVSVKRQDGTTAGVLFGSENPRKTLNYAKSPDSDEVFLSPTSSAGLFKKSLTDLRNKTVLDFETDSIDAFRLTVVGTPEIAFQKSDKDWLIKRQPDVKADASEISGFLSSIQFARASAFAEEGVDLKAAGLDAPAVKVTLHDAKAGADRVLLFGKSPEKDKYYAKDQARSAIFILGNEIVGKTRRPVFDWRDKLIVRFDQEAVDGIELVRGGEKLSLKKTGTDWQSSDGKKLQQIKIAEMLSILASERAVQILDSPAALASYGLDKPKLEVTLRKADKDLVAVRFGATSKTPAGVFVKTPAGPEVMTAATAFYDSFNVQLGDLAESPPPPQTPPN